MITWDCLPDRWPTDSVVVLRGDAHFESQSRKCCNIAQYMVRFYPSPRSIYLRHFIAQLLYEYIKNCNVLTLRSIYWIPICRKPLANRSLLQTAKTHQ